MAKITEKYEALVILSTKVGEENVKALVEKISALISANATLEKTDEWGKRRLAYPINYETEGYYVCLLYTSILPIAVQIRICFEIFIRKRVPDF